MPHLPIALIFLLLGMSTGDRKASRASACSSYLQQIWPLYVTLVGTLPLTSRTPDQKSSDFQCGIFAGMRYGRLWIVVDFGNGPNRQLLDIIRVNSKHPDYGSEGREFESLRAHQKNQGLGIFSRVLFLVLRVKSPSMIMTIYDVKGHEGTYLSHQ